MAAISTTSSTKLPSASRHTRPPGRFFRSSNGHPASGGCSCVAELFFSRLAVSCSSQLGPATAPNDPARLACRAAAAAWAASYSGTPPAAPGPGERAPMRAKLSAYDVPPRGKPTPEAVSIPPPTSCAPGPGLSAVSRAALSTQLCSSRVTRAFPGAAGADSAYLGEEEG